MKKIYLVLVYITLMLTSANAATTYTCSTGLYNSTTGKCIYDGLYKVAFSVQPDVAGYNYWAGQWGHTTGMSYSEVNSFIIAGYGTGTKACLPWVTQTDAKAKEIVSAHLWYLGRCPGSSPDTQSIYDAWYADPTWSIAKFQAAANITDECSAGQCPKTPALAMVANVSTCAIENDYVNGTATAHAKSVTDYDDGTSTTNTGSVIDYDDGTSTYHTGSVVDYTSLIVNNTSYQATVSYSCPSGGSVSGSSCLLPFYTIASISGMSWGIGWKVGDKWSVAGNYSAIYGKRGGTVTAVNGSSTPTTYTLDNGGQYYSIGSSSGTFERNGGGSYGSWSGATWGTTGVYYSYSATASYSCPNGGYVNGTTCIVSTTSCPSGYLPSGGNCYKSVAFVYYTYSCASGWTRVKADDGTTKADPSNTQDDSVALATTLGVSTPPAGNCSKNISYSYYTYSCPVGWTLLLLNNGTVKSDTDNTADNSATLGAAFGSASAPVGNCTKSVSYNYYTYSCPSQLNTQGFDYAATSAGLSSCDKNDTSFTTDDTVSLATNCNGSTPPVNNCARAYQICNLECPPPLSYEASTGKCVGSYSSLCESKGMVYNAISSSCEKANNCNTVEAYRDTISNHCATVPNCSVIGGKCDEPAAKTCDDTTFTYSIKDNKCEKQIGCTSSQVLLNNGLCGSKAVCDAGDLQTSAKCVNTKTVDKNCAPDARAGNLCYVDYGGTFNSLYQRELIKTSLSGAYKSEEYSVLKQILCTDNSDVCKFRLVKAYADNNGKSLCFVDSLGVKGCINIDGECSIDGTVDFNQGIRQILVAPDGKTLEFFNKAVQGTKIGTMTSTCEMSGKVGHIDSATNNKEIISAISSGSTIKFYDSYQRGDVGVLTFVPTIRPEDSTAGYTYEDQEIVKMRQQGFTGFSTINGDTYAVFNGLISKADCMSKITGTSYFIAQAQATDEQMTLSGLSMYGGNNYNYNDGNLALGSCVVKSATAKDYDAQTYATKRTTVDNSQSAYMCSPLTCGNHQCQYNQCPQQYTGNTIGGNLLSDYMSAVYPQLTTAEVCIDNVCDSNKPYYPQCGNTNGCKSNANVFQLKNGQCIQVSCAATETYDPTSHKCISLGCNNSIERSGKCFKTLNF